MKMEKVITGRIMMSEEDRLEIMNELIHDQKGTIAELEIEVEELIIALQNANKGWYNLNINQTDSPEMGSLSFIRRMKWQ